jgi:TRAP-type mannitol/chloroaromatic compound transport system permease small subunit
VTKQDEDDPRGRVDALERELEQERLKPDKSEARIEELENELKATQAKLKAVGETPQRRHESQPEMDVGPASRASQIKIDAPLTYPDDGALSANVRKVDNGVGMIEQAFLFLLLIAIVVTASAAALGDKLFGYHLGRWWFTVIRGGTFTIAMIAAAFATHQQRHLAMDLVSRRLTPRGRLILGMLLKVFTIVIVAILFRSGMHQREHVGGVVEEFISDKTIVTMMPIGCALIILHSLLHIVIDIDYLVRGKLPPERARSAH